MGCFFFCFMRIPVGSAFRRHDVEHGVAVVDELLLANT